MVTPVLTERWTHLFNHSIQSSLWNCTKRFLVVPAGRRSGKTELAKRKLVIKAIEFYGAPNGRFICGAPTTAQAREIFWEDLKSMVPDYALAGSRKNSISETMMTVWLWNGAKIQVIGMDRPERAEGSPIDGMVLDEYGNMKASVWTEHLRPALSTLGRLGWCWFIGVPEGRNHYHQLFLDCDLPAKAETWESFTWKTADINPAEAEAAKADMDLLTYLQEYEGSFVSFEGRAYYDFDSTYNVPPKGERCVADLSKPLIFTFDFNRKPGVAGVLQELPSPKWLNRINGRNVGLVTTGVDEVWLENNSNTKRVCDRLLAKYSGFKQKVYLYGDASGGAGGSAKVEGSDWDLIRAKLKPVFGDRLISMVPKGNPRIRSRVNSVNGRFKAADGMVRAVFDAVACRYHIRDFEGVSCDSNGDLEKSGDVMLSHISDAFGYYTVKKHPCGGVKGIKRGEV